MCTGDSVNEYNISISGMISDMKSESIVHVAKIPLVLKRCTMSILVQTWLIYVTCVIQGAKMTDLALSEQ